MGCLICGFPLLLDCRSGSLSTETKVESGTSQSKSGTSVNLSNSGVFARQREIEVEDLEGEASNEIHSFSSLLLSSLELSDTQVYEPQIGALLGTAAH